MPNEAALTIAVALTAGMLAHALARHLRVPSILVLLVAGVVLGPDGLGVVRPQSIGSSLYGLVGGAVAIILFEGGLRLQLRRLRREPQAIRRLVTLGALLSALGGAAAAHHILGWDWRVSMLFGTLMIVTGPTVVTPLLERLRVQRNVATVLEAEGVLIDAVGAVTAAVALDIALSPSGEGFLLAAPQIALRLGCGSAFGVVAGGLLALLLRYGGTLLRQLQNTLILAAVLLLHEASNAFLPDSGLAAATVAGITLANLPAHEVRALADFKQQLVHLLIGMLFLLLVAAVRLSEVVALGLGGAAVVAVLLFVVRPIVAVVCTQGTGLSGRERVLVAWLSPRGVVAAAVASLFAFKLEGAGAGGGLELRALVFATIAASVVWCSVTGGPIAGLLHLRRPADRGWVVLGGHPLGRRLAELLDAAGEPSVVLDYNPQLVRAVQGSGLRALHGNALDARLLARAELETRAGAIGLTSNPEANLLFVKHARRHAPELRYLVAVRDDLDGVTSDIVRAEGCHVMSAGAIDVELWSRRLQRDEARVEWWTCVADAASMLRPDGKHPPFIPLAVCKDGRTTPVGDDDALVLGQQLAVMVELARAERARDFLCAAGFAPSVGAPAAVPLAVARHS